MILKKAILHILDFSSDVCVFSTKELDIADFGTGEFIEKHLTKILEDGASRKGEFQEFSLFAQVLDRYKREQIDFAELSTSAGHLVYDALEGIDEPEPIDFMVCQFTDETNEYLALMVLPNKTAYTHQVENTSEGACNKLIRYFTILPGTNQRISSYALIDLNNGQIRLCDKKRSIQGEDIEILPQKVLQCVFNRSDRDTVKIIKKIAGQVAEEFGANPAVAVSRAKSCIIENAEANLPFTPSDICEEVFFDNDVMKQSFREKAMEAEMPGKIQVENAKVVKSIRSHKIKTDTGIEITIPTEYLENNRYVEFINNPDGTISISLKNIGKIVNRQ